MMKRQELRGSTRLRSNELPPEALVLLRGAPQELDDLVDQAADAGRRYSLDGEPFYSLSLTALIDGFREADLLKAPPLVGYPQYYRMRAGDLYDAGYTVWATFTRPTHYDVRLPEATPQALTAFLAIAGELHDNRYHQL